jgi:cell volume regulation protein A
VRTVVLLPVLARVGIDRSDCRIIAWFGPRGLSSLLLVLLPVFAGVPGSERLFEITCLVVLLSVVLHGGGIALYLRRLATVADDGAERGATAPAPRPAPRTPPPGPSEPEAEVPERITIEEFTRLRDEGRPVIVADVRTERSYRDDKLRAAGALRLPPDDAVRLARERRLDQYATLVLYCT